MSNHPQKSGSLCSGMSGSLYPGIGGSLYPGIGGSLYPGILNYSNRIKSKLLIVLCILASFCKFLLMSYNVPRTGARNPVLRLRQGYGACALLNETFGSYLSKKQLP
jgi:hypothetical protein